MKLNRFFLVQIFLLITFLGSAQQAPETIKNPILSGFHPDPSFCRVGDTYYMVTSTFEWFPGVPVFRSKDLVNWEKIGHCIHRPEQIIYDEKIKNSGGIYAPTIRHHNGTFYMITTMVGGKNNFIVTAKNPAGPWSDPMWIKDAPGIDPSLFWDDDGKCYFTGAALIDGSPLSWPGKNGVWMQEIDPDKGVFLGERKQLTYGHAANARWAEAPHVYKINGEYVLMISEGGTSEFHAVTILNSKNIWGPYIPNHANPILTHRHLGYTYPIIQTGHADLVQTQNGEWWSVVLAKRPVEGYSILARETFLAKVEVTRNESGVTLIYNPGKGLILPEQKRPNLTWTPVPELKKVDNFDSSTLDLEWNMLRTPKTLWYKLANGFLEMSLRPEIISEYSNPSFLAKRVLSHKFEVATKMTFSTKNANEMAGLVIYRKSSIHYQLVKMGSDIVLLKSISEDVTNEKGIITEVARIAYKGKEVVLKVEGNDLKAKFFFGPNSENLQQIGNVQDLSIISDEIAGGFNGTYVGLYATSSGVASKAIAFFDWFKMNNIK